MRIFVTRRFKIAGMFDLVTFPLPYNGSIQMNSDPARNSEDRPGLLSLLDAHDYPYWRLHVPALRTQLESYAQRPLRRQNPGIHLYRSTRHLWRFPDMFPSNAHDLESPHQHGK